MFRFQSNYRIQTGSGKPWLSAKELYEARGMQAGQVQHWEKVGFTEAHQIPGLTMTVHWGAESKEPLCLISSLPVSEVPHLIYEMRFWIETLFGNQKARGFQLARTQMTTPAHIDRLILALVIGTCIALGLGTHLIVTSFATPLRPLGGQQAGRVDVQEQWLMPIILRWLLFLRLPPLQNVGECPSTAWR